jgi:hypothetical protein
MYPKGINHGSMGMKNVGGKLMGGGKGMTNAEHAVMMAAMVTPEVPKKPYGKIEKK